MRQLLLSALLTGLLVPRGHAQSEQRRDVPVTRTRADSGEQMFRAYCASCHGVDGKGDGPAAAALKVAPPDLTSLKRSNGGKFPDRKVRNILAGADDLSAHGSAGMPVWGPVLRSLHPGNESVVNLRIANLVAYLSAMQK